MKSTHCVPISLPFRWSASVKTPGDVMSELRPFVDGRPRFPVGRKLMETFCESVGSTVSTVKKIAYFIIISKLSDTCPLYR